MSCAVLCFLASRIFHNMKLFTRSDKAFDFEQRNVYCYPHSRALLTPNQKPSLLPAFANVGIDTVYLVWKSSLIVTFLFFYFLFIYLLF
jgi:hypothetical protein